MKKSELLEHMDQADLCKILDKHPTTVCNWPEKLPRSAQFEIAWKFQGRFLPDPDLFNGHEHTIRVRPNRRTHADPDESPIAPPAPATEA